ncbi:MAG: hypothetical protein CMM07_11430 [Rhodopirellula sp.]|nr:hypothetical protein [Rhodopirellula sp.]
MFLTGSRLAGTGGGPQQDAGLPVNGECHVQVGFAHRCGEWSMFIIAHCNTLRSGNGEACSKRVLEEADSSCYHPVR